MRWTQENDEAHKGRPMPSASLRSEEPGAEVPAELARAEQGSEQA